MNAAQPSVLEVTEGPLAGQTFKFERHETFVVGRSKKAHLRLNQDPYFSRFHFRLEVNPPQCRLVDLDSRNGTLVNGERVESTMLIDGDVISGGKTKMVYRAPLEDGTEIWQPPSEHWDPAEPDGSEPAAHDFPGFELIEPIGRGGFGAVYLARKMATDERVAIKMLLPRAGMDETVTRLFLREVSLLSQLDHPRIVRFREMGIALSRPFVVMDYIDTISLEKTLEVRPPGRRIQIVAWLASRVLEALEYAHELGIVHRDVKPSNVLAYRDGARLLVKLTDFGLAKNFEEAGLSGITTEGEMRGSLPYMSPEQVLDSRAVKPTTDVYAMGATMFQWLTRELPYDCSRTRAAIAAILDERVPPRSLTEYVPEAPAGFVAVIERALAKKSEDRYQSAAEMRRALGPYAQPSKSEIAK